VFRIPALTRPATATPATTATLTSAVAAVAIENGEQSNVATPATSATDPARVADVAHVAVADARLRAAAFCRAIIGARDAAGLEYWRGPLLLGQLQLCGNCSRYAFGHDPAGSGRCSLHGDGLLAFALPFDCPDFAVSPSPTAPEFLTESVRARVPEHPR
jgi:hypothetical protein